MRAVIIFSLLLTLELSVFAQERDAGPHGGTWDAADLAGQMGPPAARRTVARLTVGVSRTG